MMELLVVSLMMLAVPAPAATEEAAVIRVQHAACAAFEKGDATALALYLDPGFTLTDSRGHVTMLEENLAEVRNREPRYELFRNHDMKTRIYGNAAVVNGITSVKGTAGGEPFEADFQFTDTMVKSGGRWRMAASHASRIPPKTPAAEGKD